MFVLTDINLDINYNIVLFNDTTTVEFKSIDANVRGMMTVNFHTTFYLKTGITAALFGNAASQVTSKRTPTIKILH